MLEAVILFLLFMWLIGIATGTAGNLIHFLVIVALLMFIVRFFSGRKAF